MAGPDVQREGRNESQLHRERLASSRMSDAAAQENLQRFSGASWQPPPPIANAGGAQAMSGVARQQQLETQLNLQRRQEQKPENDEQDDRPSPRQDATAAAGKQGGPESLMNVGPGQGLPTEDIQRGVGRSCLMSLWNSLWPTFGHTIYFIAILFFISWASKFARTFIPSIGEEWFPSQLLKKMPKATLIPIKLAETVAVMFLLFFVLMLDLGCIAILAFILGAIMSAASLV